ncbi:endolytic transglycosylase MltG [Nereida sp. MMG025]|uniref:endolytic transglycosylase MltG n=1 Tax=Nereida sp. MMG025 TaxID=2909981 RepID=UPI001F005F14|nr:endolytic transglycosylase MltG [Nereida sp. MMG025]MCF6443496.1 endolytic transglycosylase MltG [Nereida sp. MMG025]
MWRHVVSNVLTLAIVVLFLVGGVILWGANTYSAQGPLDRAICLQVQSGSTMRRVSQNLADQGAISSASIFRMGADYSDKTGQLKAGSFLIEQGASMEEIVDIVTRGGRNTCGTRVVYRIGVTRSLVQVSELDPASGDMVDLARFNPATEDTPDAYTQVKDQQDTQFLIALAEGVTSWTIVEALNDLDLLEGEITAIPPEGSLAPDTYEISEGQNRADVLARMAARQDTILAEAWANRAEGLPLESPEEALILASIVEKETGVAEERRQVASVFINRLNRGMKLQTDPTVIYGITKGQGTLGRGLRRSELRAATPWNTYVIDALPPTPIANPGRLSIEAALNPDETPYIFFVADGTGGHAFAVTLEEHNRNVAVWRQIEAERAAETQEN